MPRRKRPNEKVLSEHRHLVDLEVVHFDADLGLDLRHQSGRVTKVEAVDGRAYVTVEFPRLGSKRLCVVGGRRPPGVGSDYIRLSADPDNDPYRWADAARARKARQPSASFRVHVEAAPWERTSAKTKQALADSLAAGLADAIRDALDGGGEAGRDSYSVLFETSGRGGGEAYDVTITVQAFDIDAAAARDWFERLHYLLDAVADDDPERWPSYLADRDLRRIYASAFVLEAEVGGQRLGPVRGRLPLR